jgi:SAM-dependent methyltransferase
MNCPSCGAQGPRPFLRLEEVPANSCILLPSREEATAYPKGDICLAFCLQCGFIFNTAHDPRLTQYTGRYEETQGFSPTFNAFHRDLARRLTDRYDLRGKDIVEIGCGKGEFLTLLCELGGNRGTGFDPSHVSERVESEAASRITFIKDFYGEKYAPYQGDFICCKMTLEHIPRPYELVSLVRRSIGERPDTVVFFQVPNVLRILRQCAFEDIYYEHCSYFSPGSLSRLFRRCGFQVLRLGTEYDDQYLTIEAAPSGQAEPAAVAEEEEVTSLLSDVEAFGQAHARKLEGWNRRLSELAAAGHRAVLWGSGSKAVAFLSSVQNSELVEYAVDINPYRQGFYLPGSGRRIVAPEFLRDYRPDTVIIMNAVYRDEIGNELARLGLAPQLLTTNDVGQPR